LRQFFISIVAFLSCGLHAIEEETDAYSFYDAFRVLVLANDRDRVADLIAYPLNDEVKSKSDLLVKYDVVFSERLVSLIECTTSEDLSHMGWRGYMVLNGVLWIDGVYFGEIIPVKSSQTYAEDYHARVEDKNHWYMRVYGINNDIGACPDAP
jgi:hypothetical protein